MAILCKWLKNITISFLFLLAFRAFPAHSYDFQKSQEMPSAIGTIIQGKRVLCMGTLLRPGMVLTAAHCVEGFRFHSLHSLKFRMTDSQQTHFIAIQKVQVHPKYQRLKSEVVYDLAVLFLERPVHKVPALTLVPSKGLQENQPLLVFNKQVGISSRIKESNSHRIFLDTGHQLLCRGTSGGPVLLREKGKLYIAGVVSYALTGISSETSLCSQSIVAFQTSQASKWLSQLQLFRSRSALGGFTDKSENSLYTDKSDFSKEEADFDYCPSIQGYFLLCNPTCFGDQTCKAGRCVRPEGYCEDKSHCSSKQVCRGKRCVPACSLSSDCGRARLCHPQKRWCISPPRLPCQKNEDCPKSECNRGQCLGVKSCIAKTDCPIGTLCFHNLCLECVASKDCASGETCIAYTCVNPSEAELEGKILRHSKSPEAGRKVTLSIEVSNTGPAPAENFKTRFYIGKKLNNKNSGTYLEVERVDSLASAQKLSYSVTLTIPAQLASGSYFVGMMIDYNNKIKEANELNNTTSVSMTLSEPEPNINPTQDAGGRSTPEQENNNPSDFSQGGTDIPSGCTQIGPLPSSSFLMGFLVLCLGLVYRKSRLR